MPDRIDNTYAAIRKPWFMGPGSGNKYVQILDSALEKRLADRARIDQALSLGTYLLHTQGNKNARHVTRAYLLAEFLLQGEPLIHRDALRAHCRGWSRERLIRAFRSCFPVITDQGKRNAWDPANFTQPVARKDLQERRVMRGHQLAPYKFLVHCLTQGKEGNLLVDPATEMRGWDAISTSVISTQKLLPYSNYGLILRVPKNNILTTSPTDQWFDNYAGTARAKEYKPQVPDSPQGRGLFADQVHDKNLMIGGLLTPDEVLQFTGSQDAIGHMAGAALTAHNEVIVCGRPGAPLHHGVTGAIEVAGAFALVARDGALIERKVGHAHYAKIKPDTLDRLRRMARQQNVPLLYLSVG